MTRPNGPWFRKRPSERGGGFDIASWQGAAVLAAFVLIVCGPPLLLLLATGSLIAFFLSALACAVGGAWWLVRTIRAQGVPDA